MCVHVEDALAGLAAGVEDGPEVLQAFLAGHVADGRHQCCCEIRMGGQFRYVGEVLARDDQDVGRRLRFEVRERVGLVVLIDGGGRNLARNDLAEDAVGIHAAPGWPVWVGGTTRSSAEDYPGEACNEIVVARVWIGVGTHSAEGGTCTK